MPGNYTRLLSEALNLGIVNARDLDYGQLKHAVSLYKIMNKIRSHAQALDIVLPDTLATVASLELALCQEVEARLEGVAEESVITYDGKAYVVEKVTRRPRPTFHNSRVTYVIRPVGGGRHLALPATSLLRGMMAK